MDSLLIPLDVILDPSIKLPFILFELNKVKVSIDNFITNEKEGILGIQNLQINGASMNWSGKHVPPYGYENHFLKSALKLIISSEEIEETDQGTSLAQVNADRIYRLQKIQQKINSAMKIVMGCDLSIYRICSSRVGYDGAIFYSMSNHWISRRERIVLDDKKISKIKELVNILSTQEYSSKIETSLFFLDTAMQTNDLDIAGAFYITLLESIFVSDKDVEIGYRFSMRLTKMCKGNLDYKNRINKLYGYRSRVFHGQKGIFSLDDVKFVEEEATKWLEEYIKNKDLFFPERLDSNLL